MKSNTFINLRYPAAWMALATVIILPQLSWAVDLSQVGQIFVFAQFGELRCGPSPPDMPSIADEFPNQIIVRSLSDATSRPFNANTGQLTRQGQATAGPLKITKDFDGCSPLLYRALVRGENFFSVVISFVALDQKSLPGRFFEIELINAHVQSMTQSFNNGFPLDEVNVIFERMRLTDRLSGQAVTVTCDFVADSCS
jgi:type VI secretion system Hcp family effector